MAITQQEIRELFRETDRILQENARALERMREENDRRAQENDRRARENEALLARMREENDRRARENEEASARRARENEEASARRARENEEVLARMREETDRRIKETDRAVKEANQAIGRLGNRLGQFVEEMVRPAVVRLFRGRGIDVHHVFPRATASYEDDAMEVDLLVVNAETAVLVEAKSELKIDDVHEHLHRLGRFKKLFPAFQNHRVMGAVAAMVVSDETARFAYRQGLFVLGQSGESMVLRNGEAFEPKIW